MAAGLVLLATAFSTLAVGGAPRLAACCAAGLAVLAALPYVTSRRALARPGPLLIFLAAAAAVTALQLVPLPVSFLELVSGKADLAAANAAALGQADPGLTSISYDPAATLVEVAKLLGYICLGYAAIRIASVRGGRLLLASGLGALGLAMVVIVLAHHVTSAEALYGLYQPRFARPRYLAPLLNPNHLSGLLALIAPVCLGLAVHAAGPRRYLWAGAVVAMVCLSLLIPSRAGTVALAIGLAVSGALLRVRLPSQRAERKQGTKGSKVPLAPIAVVVACAVVLVVALNGGKVWRDLSATTGDELTAREGKLAVWRAAMPLLGEHWLTGVGRGGFEPAFVPLNDGSDTSSHVENEYLQAALDWGIPIAAALGVLFAMLAWKAARRWRAGPLEAGTLGGLLALALHNTLDFSLWLPGVVAPAVLGLALVLQGRMARRSSPRVALGRGAAAAVALGVVALAASPLGRAAYEDAADLAASARAGMLDVGSAQEAWQRHPADYVSAGYTAQALHARKDPRTPAVVARALELNPRHPDLHLLAARLLLASQARGQALVEYRLALRHASDARVRTRIVDEIVHFFPDPADAVRGLPDDPDLAAKLIARLLARDKKPLALAYSRRVAELHPRDVAAWQALSRVAQEQGETAIALRAAEQAIALGEDAESAQIYALALLDSGRTQEAIQALDRAITEGYPASATVTSVELMRTLAKAQLASGQPDQARDALTRALGLAATDRRRAAAVHRDLASLEEGVGNKHQARWHRRQAASASRK